MDFTSELADDMQALIEKWRNTYASLVKSEGCG